MTAGGHNMGCRLTWSMKRAICLFALALMVSTHLSLRAAPRDDLWRQVNEAVQKGLPKTAITNLEPIIAGALKDKAYAEAAKATWKSSAELKAQYGSASVVSSERVVFNIKGNDYRLVVAINYYYQVLLIIWVGTHKEYDQIDVGKVEYDKRRYADPSNSD